MIGEGGAAARTVAIMYKKHTEPGIARWNNQEWLEVQTASGEGRRCRIEQRFT